MAAGVRTWRTPGPHRDARGAAAAEAAAVLPVLASVVMALVWMLSLAATHMRVVDAAREAARVAARAESAESAVEAGRKVAPDGTRISVQRRGAEVVVQVKAEVRGPSGMFAFLPLPIISATATSVREDR